MSSFQIAALDRNSPLADDQRDMPWQLIATGGALGLLLAAWLFRRRQPSAIGRMPDVGQPPDDAEPIIEPRMQDIGFASYELPLPGAEKDPDRIDG